MNIDYPKAIKNVAWSVVLSTFHINIGVFDILPDWLGYILLFSAVKTISDVQPTAGLLKPFALVIIADSILDTVLKFMGISMGIYVYNLVISVIYIYIYFQILTDIWHTAENYNTETGWLIPPLRNITTVTHTIAFVLMSMEGNIYVIMAAAVVNIVMKTRLAFHLFSHAKDEKFADADL